METNPFAWLAVIVAFFFIIFWLEVRYADRVGKAIPKQIVPSIRGWINRGALDWEEDGLRRSVVVYQDKENAGNLAVEVIVAAIHPTQTTQKLDPPSSHREVP